MSDSRAGAESRYHPQRLLSAYQPKGGTMVFRLSEHGPKPDFTTSSATLCIPPLQSNETPPLLPPAVSHSQHGMCHHLGGGGRE